MATDELMKTISTWEQICDFPPVAQQVLFCYQTLKDKKYDLRKIQEAGLKHYENSRKFPMPADLIPILEGPDFGRVTPLPPPISKLALPVPTVFEVSTVEEFKKRILLDAKKSKKGEELFVRHQVRGAIMLEGLTPFTKNMKQAVQELYPEKWKEQKNKMTKEQAEFRRIFR